MYVNKVGESESADLFFEIMSKFNNIGDSIEKFALIKEASGLASLSKLTRLSGETAQAGVGVLGKTVDDILSVGGQARKATQRVPINGVDELLASSAKGLRNTAALKKSFKVLRQSLSDSLADMTGDIGKYVDEFGEFTKLGKDKLKLAAQKSGGARSAAAADELVEAITTGKIFDPAFAGGPVQKSFAEVAGGGARVGDDASKAAKAAAEAVEASRLKAVSNASSLGDDFIAIQNKTTGEWSVARKGASETAETAAEAAARRGRTGQNVKLTPEELLEASKRGGKEAIDDVQEILRKAKSRNVAGASQGDVVKNAFDALDEAAEAALRIKPKSLSKKVLFYIQDLKATINSQKIAAGKITQTIGDVRLNNVSGSTINIINEVSIGKFNKILDAMDDGIETSIRQLGGIKGNMNNLNRIGDTVAGGGRGTGRATGVGGGGGGGGGASARAGDVNVNVNVGGAGRMGDQMMDTSNEALQIHLRALTQGQQEMSTYLVRNGDAITAELSQLRRIMQEGGPGAAAAGKQYDDFIKVIQRMDNVGNINISGKLLKELQEAGVKVGAGTTSRWGKFAKVIAWAGGLTALGMGLHWGYGKLKGSGDDSGGGGGGGPSPFPSEGSGSGSGSDPYIGVRDPAARESLALADPRSSKYDPQNGWQAAGNTIYNLQNAGKPGELSAYLNALQLAYRKRFRMKLDPPFPVTGSPIPLYYAFVNQHRAPAPNLSERTGRTLAIKTMVLNDGLQDPAGEGPVEVFDVNYRLMGNDAQKAINYTAEETVAKGLAERGRPWYHFGFGSSRHTGRSRSKDHSYGEEMEGETGMRGQRSRNMTNADRLMIKRIMESRGSDRLHSLKKFAELSVEDRLSALNKFAELSIDNNAKRLIRLESLANIANKSTNITENTDNQTLDKKADDFSKSYYKDAIADLNNTDKTLRSYFAGLGGLYDQRLEKRKADFKTLYNVTDETGEDLIYSAHPKEVVVSDSIGRGGLVENGLEQKRQTHGVALSAPTGNYRANYASRYDALRKLAN